MASPFSIYQEHCRRGELAYQVGPDGKPIFYPRLVAPGSGSADLEWRVAQGTGTVYATTVIYSRGEAPYNVAIIELDEGFRLMSRVEGIAPEAVNIGMRVRLAWHPGPEGEPPYPVFRPAENRP